MNQFVNSCEKHPSLCSEAPIDFRPVPFYFINTHEGLSYSDIFLVMENLRDSGFGGCMVFNKPPTGFSSEDYLGDEWFEMVGHFARAGRKLGLQVWINDGFDYPPGSAAGRIEKINPSLKQQMLQKSSDGSIEVVELDWGFPAFEEPESSQLFIELVYEEYYKRLGDTFGNGITGFFSDADCRRINAHIMKELEDGRYFPWSKNFASEFLNEYGYEVESYLVDIMNESGSKACRDYWRLAGLLYARWFQNNYEWCKAHGVLYSFHTSDTGPFVQEECARSSIFAEGAFLHQAKFCDYPGTDHELLALDGGTHFDSRYYVPSASWGGSDERVRTPDFNVTKWDIRAKYTASAAYLYGRKRALCEAFAATNWGATHQDLRRIATWQIMQGINFFVHHAVHHRVHGKTKYFAPPEFCSGSLRHGLRLFNDWLSEMCCTASQGTLAEPVAVFDPTEAVLAGNSDGRGLFELCDQLNRMPINYVIADKTALLENADHFKFLLLPDVPLEKEMQQILTENGCTILDANETGHLPLPDIHFDGGEIHYLRRKLDDGTEILLVANVWSDTALEGDLHWNGRTVCLRLESGEIAVLGGPHESFCPVKNSTGTIELPDKIPVRWESVNMVLLPHATSFKWTNATELPAPGLLVPDTGLEFTLDGQPVGEGTPVMFFDQPYREIILPSGGAIGEHTLELNSARPSLEDPLFLTGDFDVHIATEGDFSTKEFSYYSMDLYSPASYDVTLSPRSETLRPGSWADQGAPFYSGSATYLMEIEHKGGPAILILPEVNHVCSLRCDEVEVGQRIWPPYEFEWELSPGHHQLEITVHNSLANAMEGYLAPSGIGKSNSHI